MSPRPRSRRRAARLGLAGAVVAVGAGAAFGPSVLREAEVFRVERVEVAGTRFVEPYAVVRAAGLRPGSNVFDDADAWSAGVLTLPLVDRVAVRRKLPSTVVLEVTEVQPLALVADGPLRPVDAAGRVVPLDPAGAVLDLPILAGVRMRDGRVTGPGADAALGVLAALRAAAPKFGRRISQIEVGESALRVAFRDDRGEALLPLEPTALQLTQLRLAYADLAARGELGKVRRIDVRFRDQVVVSFLQKPVS